MLIKAGGAARRSRQRLRSEEVDHQAALLGVVVIMRMMRRMRGMMGIRVFKGTDSEEQDDDEDKQDLRRRI